MKFATARQRFLLFQGYTYQVVQSFDLNGYDDEARERPFIFSKERELTGLLDTLLSDDTTPEVLLKSR